MDKYIYLGGPIHGLSKIEANAWRLDAAQRLAPLISLSPLREENGLDPFGPEGEGKLPFVDRFNRDYSDIQRSHGLLFNMRNAKRKSIGTTCEIAWSYTRLIPTAMCIEPGNINDDIFLMQCLRSNPKAIVVTHIEDAISFLRSSLGVA